MNNESLSNRVQGFPILSYFGHGSCRVWNNRENGGLRTVDR